MKRSAPSRRISLPIHLPLTALFCACAAAPAPAAPCAPDPGYASCPAGSAYLCGDSVACCADATCDDSISPADHCALAPQLDSACGSGVALECADGLHCFPADCAEVFGAPKCPGHVEYSCSVGVPYGSVDPAPPEGVGSDCVAADVNMGGSAEEYDWCCP